MRTRGLARLAWDEQGNGLLGYIVVVGSFSLLVLRPTLIVAAVDRLYTMILLFIGQFGSAF